MKVCIFATLIFALTEATESLNPFDEQLDVVRMRSKNDLSKRLHLLLSKCKNEISNI